MSIGILIRTSLLSDIVKEGWDYEKNVNIILAEVKKDFPDASSLRPKGWYKISKDYKDFDGMIGLDTATLSDKFKGMDSSTAGASSFEVRVSLPHVMYDNKRQGRKPLEVLVGAMLGHAYVMSEHNNNSKMLKEWIDFSKEMKTSSTPYKFKEPLNQALNAIIEFKDYSANNPKALEILGIEPSIKKKLRF